MIFVDEILISSGVLEGKFCCDLLRCRGICCVEGDYGAPLEDDEIEIVEKIIENHSCEFGQESNEVIAKTGAAVWYDKKKIWGTPLRKNGACVFSKLNSDSIHVCIIENLFNQGKVNFRKPISCHLYPLRIKQVGEYTVFNYDEWNICEHAVRRGNTMGLSIVQFCKEALIRGFGEEFYEGLIKEATKKSDQS